MFQCSGLNKKCGHGSSRAGIDFVRGSDVGVYVDFANGYLAFD